MFKICDAPEWPKEGGGTKVCDSAGSPNAGAFKICVMSRYRQRSGRIYEKS